MCDSIDIFDNNFDTVTHYDYDDDDDETLTSNTIFGKLAQTSPRYDLQSCISQQSIRYQRNERIERSRRYDGTPINFLA